MAYRRRHGISRSSTFKEEISRPPEYDITSSSAAFSPSSSLSSQAIRASKDFSPSSAYANSAFHSSFHHRSKEGHSIVYKKTQDMEETHKQENRRRESNHEEYGMQNQWQDPRMHFAEPQTNHEHRLKASRDVAIATAAKAKLLLREIKTIKADLAFAKQRNSQLVEENKMLREAHERGDHPADDMIRLQLETLLAEKARLGHKNSVYARENHCLREIIKYHKLSMQDVVYLDEGIEEVAEVNPGVSRTLSVSPPSPSSHKETSQTQEENVNVPTDDALPSYGNPATPLKHASTCT